MDTKLVIIPTYNEKENIAAIITAVMNLPLGFHVLIIDDGSPDGTAAIVKDLMQTTYEGRLHMIERAGKLGLGTAYITGFKWAIEHKYDYIFDGIHCYIWIIVLVAQVAEEDIAHLWMPIFCQ